MQLREFTGFSGGLELIHSQTPPQDNKAVVIFNGNWMFNQQSFPSESFYINALKSLLLLNVKGLSDLNKRIYLICGKEICFPL